MPTRRQAASARQAITATPPAEADDDDNKSCSTDEYFDEPSTAASEAAVRASGREDRGSPARRHHTPAPEDAPADSWEVVAVSPAATAETEAAGQPGEERGKREASPAPTRPTVDRRGFAIPAALQFPLLALLSMSISSLGYSLVTEWSRGDLAAVSRSLDTWGEVAALAAWRMTELALGWFGQCDWVDLAALNVLSHGPVLYLLATFYGVSAPTVLAALSIDVLSTLLPFMLLRPLSSAHSGDKTVPNREIVADVPLLLYTVGLATALYSVVLVTALHLYLPRVLVLYFEGLPTLTPAYTASYLSAVPVMVLFGLAARTFIFTPYETTGRTSADAELDRFDPVAASLRETFWFNACGYTSKTKVFLARTAAAAAVTGINTYLQSLLTVHGVQAPGSAAYAAVWAAAAALTGTGLALVDRD